MATKKNISLARDWVFENCRCFGLKGRKLIAVKIITSEIATNVVKHAYSNGQQKQFSVNIKISSKKLVLTVVDNGSGFHSSKKSGFHYGLLIVRFLADRVRISTFGFHTKVKAVLFLNRNEVCKPVAPKLRLISN
ncbi:MAG: ATP-binding protein [Actinobacteria bacterium]|nr:MAG: ATP-binding protein [Actinomycetota bacterium]